jgi:hypothetical protein
MKYILYLLILFPLINYSTTSNIYSNVIDCTYVISNEKLATINKLLNHLNSEGEIDLEIHFVKALNRQTFDSYGGNVIKTTVFKSDKAAVLIILVNAEKSRAYIVGTHDRFKSNRYSNSVLQPDFGLIDFKSLFNQMFVDIYYHYDNPNIFYEGINMYKNNRVLATSYLIQFILFNFIIYILFKRKNRNPIFGWFRARILFVSASALTLPVFGIPCLLALIIAIYVRERNSKTNN